MNAKPVARRQILLTGLLLFAAGLLVFGLAAWVLRAPGYMDAEYYFMNGQRLAASEGFTENVIWNYLDNPQGLPRVSHTYWLPLTSLTAALGLLLSGGQQFLAAQRFFCAQVPFVLVAAAVPVITYRIALRLYGRQREALLAGVLALFSGFYLPYQVTTSTLGLYMLEGGLFFGLLLSIEQSKSTKSLSWGYGALGAVSGLMYVTRSDGILWVLAALVLPFLGAWLRGKKEAAGNKTGLVITRSGFALAGFLLVSGFWLLHNLDVFGRLTAPGGASTLWLSDYNQMFAYPPADLSFNAWLGSGIGEIFSVRLHSTWENLKTLLGAEGQIILLPLAGLGLRRLRKFFSVKALLILWAGTFLLMSWVFPFAGMRGGFFHASAAFQPLVWCLAPAGFDAFIQWGVQVRRWQPERAWKNFAVLLTVLAALFTGGVYFMKVVGSDPAVPLWRQSAARYAQIEQEIRKTFPDISTVMVVNNPPGYTLASGGRPAVALPAGDEQSLQAVVEQFNGQIVAVDQNTDPGLMHLYTRPASSDWLEYLYTAAGTRIYRVREPE
jgi:hypothetical protein